MSPSRLSRRQFLGTAGAAAIAAIVARGGARCILRRRRRSAPSTVDAAVPFHGAHQAGIVTPAQDRLLFASFDVITDDRDELVAACSQEWTRGVAPHDHRSADRHRQHRPGRAARRHRRGRRPRSGVAHAHVRVRRVAVRPRRRPVPHRGAQARGARRRCPRSRATRSIPTRSDGDLAVQACANDPTVAFHAIRNLTRIGRGVVALRWSQSGFGRTSSTDIEADDAAQPHGVQGRHQQHRRRGHRRARSDHVWVADATTPRGCAAAATSSPAASACCSRSGTARRSPTRS